MLCLGVNNILHILNFDPFLRSIGYRNPFGGLSTIYIKLNAYHITYDPQQGNWSKIPGFVRTWMEASSILRLYDSCKFKN